MTTPKRCLTNNKGKDEKHQCGSSAMTASLPIGIALGGGMGTALGAVFDNIGVGVAIGTTLGVSLECAGVGACAKQPKQKSGEEIES